MLPRFRNTLAAFCLAIFPHIISPVSALAQVSDTAFTYQGRLESSSVPATGLYDFTFQLYNAPVAGLHLGSNTCLNVNVADGLFSVNLDFGPTAYDEGRWLSIWVRNAGSTSYTELAPRQFISPAPHAISAAQASTATVALNGVPLGFSILGNSSIPPPGYTWTGRRIGEAQEGWAPGTDLDFTPYTAQGTAINNKFYVFSNNYTAVYDPLLDTWDSSLTQMPNARGSGPEPVILDGKIYLIGGSSGAGNWNQVYDPETNTWVEKQPFPTQFYDGQTAVADGKIYAIRLGATYMYDPLLDDGPGGNDAWVTKETPPASLGQFFSTAVYDGKIYVFGGTENAHLIYNPAEDDGDSVSPWSTAAPMITPRDFFNIVPISDKFYAIGGLKLSNNDYSAANEIYDPVTDTWTSGKPMELPRAQFAAGAVEGKIYVTGGRYLDGTTDDSTDKTEVYTLPSPPLYVHIRRQE